MDALLHDLLIVQVVNAVLGPPVAAVMRALGFEVDPTVYVIPDYLVMCGIILLFWTGVGLFVRSRLSVENPGRFQMALEEAVGGLQGLLETNIGPKGPQYLPLVGTIGLFILTANLMGLVPGMIPPTMNVNVPLGCALTVFVYYHFQGVRAVGLSAYLKHFLVPPGAPLWIAPIYLPIEIISHFSRVLSLTVRLFGNVFGEKLVVLILFSLVPFFIPLPMMLLGIIVGSLQAFIFVMLTVIYLAGAVAIEHHEDEMHGADAAAHA